MNKSFLWKSYDLLCSLICTGFSILVPLMAQIQIKLFIDWIGLTQIELIFLNETRWSNS